MGDKGMEVTPPRFIVGNLKGTKIRINYYFKKYESHYDLYTGDIPKINYSIRGISVTLCLS